MFSGQAQAALVRGAQQISVQLVISDVHRAYRMDDMPRFEIATTRYDCRTDRAPSYTSALLHDFGSTFGVNGSVGSVPAVQLPMRGSDHGVRFLLCNVAFRKLQDRIADARFHAQ